MTQSGIWIAILTGAAVSFLVRALPMTLIRKKITNRFFRSFLFLTGLMYLSGLPLSSVLPHLLS